MGAYQDYVRRYGERIYDPEANARAIAEKLAAKQRKAELNKKVERKP